MVFYLLHFLSETIRKLFLLSLANFRGIHFVVWYISHLHLVLYGKCA